MWPWIQDQDPGVALARKAEALAAALPGTAPGRASRDSIAPGRAPLVAQRICAQEMPLAPGCNSAAYVGWLGEDMGQVTTASQARAVLRANAFRDWLWFGTHRTLDATERHVFALVVGSRADSGRRLPLVEVLDAVARGRPTDAHRSLAVRSFPDLDGRPGPAPTHELWLARLADGRRDGRVGHTGDIAWSSHGL